MISDRFLFCFFLYRGTPVANVVLLSARLGRDSRGWRPSGARPVILGILEKKLWFRVLESDNQPSNSFTPMIKNSCPNAVVQSFHVISS